MENVFFSTMSKKGKMETSQSKKNTLASDFLLRGLEQRPGSRMMAHWERRLSLPTKAAGVKVYS